jgi:hypothetical protein
MQVRQLKDHLQQRGLPGNGLKEELIKRLKEEEKCTQNEGARCEVYSAEQWWCATVCKVRVLEGVEQVYVHYEGVHEEGAEWIELTPERVRPPQDDKHDREGDKGNGQADPLVLWEDTVSLCCLPLFSSRPHFSYRL